MEGLGSSEMGGSGVLLAACRLLPLRFLALSLDAGLLVVLASSGFGEDAGLLDLLVEASQRSLERLVLADSDFSQSRKSPPTGHDAAIRTASGPGPTMGIRAGHARVK